MTQQRLKITGNGFFHGMKLLRQFQTGSSCIHHLYYAAQVALSPLQAFDNLRMRVVLMIFYHFNSYPPQEDAILSSQINPTT
jgi:hypothetical protein